MSAVLPEWLQSSLLAVDRRREAGLP